MASVSGSYSSATAYTVTISGMTVGQKYHLFVADLDSSGSTTGYYCRYSQTATSTSYTYSGTCGSAYSAFNRTLRLFCTGTTATSHSVGTKYQTSDFPSSYTENKTSYMTAWSGSSGYSTNAIYFRAGTGISSYKVSYDGSTTTGNTSTAISSSTSSTVLYVRASTNATAKNITYADGYGAPYYFVEYTSSSYSTVKKTFDDNDANVYSSGTRYVKLFATRQYSIVFSANGGVWTGNAGTTSITLTYGYGATLYFSVPSNGLTRDGYTLLGWSTSSTATTATYSTTSSLTVQGSGYFYAVWGQQTYTGYIKLGEGISSGSVYADGTLKALITDSAYHEMTELASDATVTVKAIVNASGYGRPYVLKFYGSSAATSPSSTLEQDVDEPSYLFSKATRPYAELVANKMSIDLFYWDSESTDAALIAKDQPVASLTAARWNKLLAKIAEVAEALGGSFSYSKVSSGGTFYASEFNEARAGILALTGHGTLPGTKASGDEVLASYFEGSGSLKTALNAAINNYNNS